MTVTALISADTWGVSSSRFALGYLAVLAVAGVVASWASGNRSRGRRSTASPDHLTPVQLGLMSGGPALAVTVALAELRQQELVDVNGRVSAPAAWASRLSLRKPVADLDPVARAVLDCLATADPAGSRTAPRWLARQPAVVATLADERRRLEEFALLAPAGRRTVGLVATVLTTALVLVGVARIFAGLGNHKPVLFLVVLVAVAAIGLVTFLRSLRIAHLTADGRSALRQLRQTHGHVSPRLHPSWRTYGSTSVVLATALFGGAVMFAADPAFAESMHIRDAEAAAMPTPGSGSWGGGSSGGGGDGCGGGGSCGGGCGGGGCGG